MNILKIAFRNLNRQKRRSILLVVAVSFGFFIVTFIDGFSQGAMKSLEYQLAKIIGGHVAIAGAQKSSDKNEDDSAEEYLDSYEFIEKVIAETGIKPMYVTRRSELDSTLIFEGKDFSQLILGCDFDKEKLLKDSISFKEGSWETMKAENAILISEQTAENFNIRFNDILLCETKTSSGKLTVAEFQVRGISLSTSITGQVSVYANKAYINKITESPENRFHAYSIFLENANMQETVADMLEKKISEYAPVTNRMQARLLNRQRPINDLTRQLNHGKWEGTKYMVVSMYDASPEIATLIIYVQTASFVILLVLLLITMIGISNTFRMIVHERKSEIGTMRSCGVKRMNIRFLFISEAVMLSIIGSISGIALAIIAMQAVSFIPIASSSPLSLFTKDGYFSWNLSFLSVTAKFSLMIFLTLLAAVSSAGKAANMVPAEAMRVGK
ncbi:ABC transporter permease [Treponema pedis]|uniref:ABC transporter permease n=1 Tax=Treponema pedis TaxID=409322 RepID=UPI00041BF6AE|nr:FtsX-like permease family protein [Treponema pedis]